MFIETLENFGVPFVLAEDMPIFAVEAFKLFIGETAPNPASAGVLGVLLILTTALVLLVQRRFLVGPPLRHQRAPGAADPQGRARPAGAGDDLLLGASCILALVPFFAIVVLSFLEFRGPGAASAISAWPISPACSTARCGRSLQHAGLRHAWPRPASPWSACRSAMW